MFKPGDLLRNDRYQGVLYLVIDFSGNTGVATIFKDHRLALVRVLTSNSHHHPFLLCHLGGGGSENWNTSEGLKEAGFRQVGHIDVHKIVREMKP